MSKQIFDLLESQGFQKAGFKEQYDDYGKTVLRDTQFKWQNAEIAIGVYVNDAHEGFETVAVSAVDARSNNGRPVTGPLRCLYSQPDLLLAIIHELKDEAEVVRMEIKNAMAARQGGKR